LAANEPVRTVRVWDVWVRLFHWSLAAAVLYMLFNGMSGIGFTLYHRQIGEIVLLLLTFRWCLAIVGSDNLRLPTLIRSPRAALDHLVHLRRREVGPERGHNAAGAWAVLALLSSLSFQAASGLFIADDPDFPLVEGLLHGALDESAMKTLRSLHDLNAKLLIGLVALHVTMVIVYLFWAGLNLIRPMITGRTRWPVSRAVPELVFQPFALGLAIAFAVGLGGAWLLGWF